MAEAKCFTLEEFGTDCLSSAVVDINGQLLVLDTWDNAAGMALFMLGADHAGPEREPREGMLPFIGIIAHSSTDPDKAYDAGDDVESWAAGWVTVDGSTHEGDYENVAELWPAPYEGR